MRATSGRVRTAAAPLAAVAVGLVLTLAAVASAVAGQYAVALIIKALTIQILFTAMLVIHHRSSRRILRTIARSEDKLIRDAHMTRARISSDLQRSEAGLTRLVEGMGEPPAVQDAGAEAAPAAQEDDVSPADIKVPVTTNHNDADPELKRILFDYLSMTVSTRSQEHAR